MSDGVSGTVHVETISPAVMLLEIDNPPMNPLGVEMRQTFMDALDQVETHDELRCLIVTGRGRSFCAGDDLKSVGPQGEDLAGFGRLLDRLEATRVPVVAAVNGWCVGGGFELALCCDLRIAASRARLGLPEVRLAVTPGAGGTQRLPRVVGPARAKELILTGRVIGAEEAARIGLVHEVVADGEARHRADQIAAEIAARGPLAVREAKRLIDAACDVDLDAGLADELEASVRIFETEDMLEGARAFFAKRDPDYHGR